MLFKIISSTIKEEEGKYVWIEDFDIEEIMIDGKKYRVNFIKRAGSKMFQFGSSNYIFLMRLEKIE